MDEFHARYAGHAGHTLSAVRLGADFLDLVQTVDQFGAELRLGLVDVRTHDDPQDNVQIRVKAAMEATDFFTDPDFIDLADFARMVRDEAGIPLAYKSQAPNVLNALTPGGGAVIREAHGPAHSRVQGLSIYYPHDLLLPAGSEFDNPSPADHLYSRDPEILLPRLRLVNHAMRDEPRFRFPADTRWDEFLHRYYKPVADACVRLGELCLPHMIVPEGTVVILSGHGSSDSDGPQLDDVPFMWFWDLAPTLDNPAPLPNYQQGLPVISCIEEDCDRDELDDPDDDMDAEGELVPFRCLAPGTFSFRLMVWDEHHGFDRQHREDLAHNQGRHWLHFNVDDAVATLTCVLEIPEKQSHPEAVVPGQVFRYILTLPAVDPETIARPGGVGHNGAQPAEEASSARGLVSRRRAP